MNRSLTLALKGSRSLGPFACRLQMSTLASSDKRPIKAQREQTFQKLSLSPYPRYAPAPEGYPVITQKTLLSKYGHALEEGAKLHNVQVTVQGRIRSKREASKKLFFFDIEQNDHVVQLVASQARYVGEEDFRSLNRALLPGDIVRASGFIGKTNTGETSVFVTCHLELLAPCFHTIPLRSGLTDIQKRFRNRHVDLLVNPHAKHNLMTRAKVLKYIRAYLDSREFTEVETPVLSPNVGGASAKPFVTTAAAFGNARMFMRVAPELFLKQLVIGGMDRVYEVGKQFRNEGVDADHNPEFTTCEFYQTYATLEDLMNSTEEMLRGMAEAVTGATYVSAISAVSSNEIQVDLSKPFKRIDVLQFLKEKLPGLPDDFSSPDALSQLLNLLAENHLSVPQPHTVPRLLDRLISHYIEPLCEQPTFLIGHPSIMSPLSKCTDDTSRVSARFELFVNGKELVNAYEELNDPNEQRAKFMVQATERAAGDEEVPEMDKAFCDALEFALPPTGGWGMGVDRVVALLAGARHLRETIAFPVMKNDLK